VLFHNQLSDPMQSANFLKNVAIAGGMLLVFAHSQMWYGWDRIRRDRNHELETRKAEERAREAELRAARAEGKADGVATVTPAATTTTTTAPRRRWF
jgi:putative oxidoreductase